MRIELHIDRLVADDLGACSRADFITAITRELRLVLARELSQPPAAAYRRSVPRVQAALTLPAAGATAPPAGRAIGAALGSAVTSEQIFPRPRGLNR
jgi:hypothetical protein